MGNPKPKPKQRLRSMVDAKRLPKRTGANRAVAFDTETTGLIENQTMKEKWLPEVVDFYAVAFNLHTGEVYEELDLLIRPSRKMEEDVIKIHHITNEMLEGKPTFGEVAPLIQQILESGSPVFAHNASYDKEVIDIEMKRRSLEVRWPRVLCTVEQTIYLKGYRLSLTNLHELLFGEKFEDAHRAKVDTTALRRCIVELYKRGEL